MERMNIGKDKNSFDRLVAGISSDERRNMLEQLRASNIQQIELYSDSSDIEKFSGTLSMRLKREGFFYRLILKIKAFFSKSKIEDVYNNDVLYAMAKKINREHPGVINPQGETLYNLFYDQLRKVKEAADFFKPYCLCILEDPGAFYVFLSTFVAPEISDQINMAADPYAVLGDVMPDKRYHQDLNKKLDDTLKELHPSSKAKIYAAAKAVQWLISFSQLPYIHFIAQFTDIKDGVYTCTYLNAQTDFNAFAKVFDDPSQVTQEILEAVFLFSQKKELAKHSFDSDVEKAVKAFLVKSAGHFLSVQSFISVIPIGPMGKIINKDYDWDPGNLSGVEDWYSKFKSHWHKILDVRWDSWVKDKKKHNLETGLYKDFGLDHFPEMPDRPWSKLWGGIPFGCELTGGYLAWFTLEKYDDIMTILNIIIMEGVFNKSENRTEFSEAVVLFTKSMNNMNAVLENVGVKGETGAFFEHLLDGSMRTFQTQSSVENIINKLEKDIHNVTDDFCKSIRIMEDVFKGIYNESTDGVHSSMSNLNSIRGRENAQFRDKLQETREALNRSLFYLGELEPIEAVVRE